MCPIATFYGGNKRFLRSELKPDTHFAHRSANSWQLTVVIAHGYQYVQGFAVRPIWRGFGMDRKPVQIQLHTRRGIVGVEDAFV